MGFELAWRELNSNALTIAPTSQCMTWVCCMTLLYHWRDQVQYGLYAIIACIVFVYDIAVLYDIDFLYDMAITAMCCDSCKIDLCNIPHHCCDSLCGVQRWYLCSNNNDSDRGPGAGAMGTKAVVCQCDKRQHRWRMHRRWLARLPTLEAEQGQGGGRPRPFASRSLLCWQASLLPKPSPNRTLGLLHPGARMHMQEVQERGAWRRVLCLW